jgi:hypothetical protein
MRTSGKTRRVLYAKMTAKILRAKLMGIATLVAQGNWPQLVAEQIREIALGLPDHLRQAAGATVEQFDVGQWGNVGQVQELKHEPR